MAKRRAKKTVKKKDPFPEPSGKGIDDHEEPQIKNQEAHFSAREVEQQIAAIRAVRDVEIEHLLTELRLLRAYFNKEQQQTPLLKFIEENLPNVSVVNDEENKQFELKWNDKGSRLSMSCVDGGEIHASLLQRLSMAYPDCSAAMPSLGRTSLLGADNLHINDFALEELSETQTLAIQEALLTPGVTSQRLSIGRTPKTLRQPKPGEMLLSVHGSPLGVYKENNMEAIHESDEG